MAESGKNNAVRRPGPQRARLLTLLGVGATVGALLVGCGSSGGSSSGASKTYKLSWGTFKLSSAIATKIQNKQPLVFDLSFQETSEPGAPNLLRAGMQAGAAWIKKTYGVTVNVNLIGTPQTNPPQQISQIQSLAGAAQFDCVGVEPVTPGAFNNVINSTMNSGIPVMTVNTDSPDSHRLAYYGVDDTDSSSPQWTGKIAGDFTVNWAKQNNVNLTSAALVTGDTTASWAQGRMQGWTQAVTAAFPNIKVSGTPTNAFTTGYTPATIQSDMQAYMTGHSGTQFYFDSDWGAAEIAQLIGSQHLKGKVYTLGFNVDSTYIKDLQDGTLIGTVDQRYDLQAENFVKGCGQLLLGGKAPTSPYQYINPSIWTPSNVGQAVKLYNSIPGSLG
jgi:ABC-type sugar transport system substrate-binding protein